MQILEPRGIRLSWDQYCQIGRGFDDASMIGTLRNSERDISKLSGIEEQSALRQEVLRELCLQGQPILDDTIEMLHTLVCYRLGLVTSSERSEVEPILKAAGVWERFEALVFGEDVERRKPAPDPYLLVANRMGIVTGLVFEDSAAGMASAAQAGFTVIPVTEPKDLAKLVASAIEKHKVQSNSVVPSNDDT